ncbi:hypothetical protein ILYODFUR_028384 [Ilyodon furcidens]|uniref:Uncharacterized protein n=1 Tax=Ilyodon furcidens TaxID=33524 RepID=A0ABV0UMK3_9TELE
MEERKGRPWTGHQSIAGQHTDIQDKQPCKHSFTYKGNLERPVYPTVMFLDNGRKPDYLVRTHACTGRTCKWGVEPRTFLLQGNSATNCSTVQAFRRSLLTLMGIMNYYTYLIQHAAKISLICGTFSI